MNIKDHFCLSRHLPPSIALYPTRQNWKCLHIHNRQYREFHISNFGVICPLIENFDFLISWDLTLNLKDHFCSSRHLPPAIALYPTQQNWKCLHIHNRQYTEFHISNFGVICPLVENFDFSYQLGFDIQTNSDHKTKKSSSTHSEL